MSTPSGEELDRLRTESAALQQECDALLRQRDLLLRSLELHERDRQLLAFEIHDGIVQDMSAAVMLLESSEREATFSTPSAEDSFKRAVSTLRESLIESRRFIRGLIPVVLDQAGFVASLEKLIRKFEADQELPVNFQAAVQLTHLAPAYEMIILRIVQESLNNIRRHSGATHADVGVEQQGRELRISIRDQGKGFDPDGVHSARFGLTGIKERARLMGGSAKIDSQPGQGTLVEVTLPLAEAIVEQ